MAWAPEVSVLIRGPMDVKRRALTDHAIEVLRSRHDRYLRYHYIRILNAQRDALLALDHIPTEQEVRNIITAFQSRQERVLTVTYRQLYPEAVSMVSPVKSVTRREMKAVDEVVSNRLEQWIRTNLGIHITAIDRTTLDAIIAAMGPRLTDMTAWHDMILDVFRSNPVRATTIARTETTSASNTAMQVAAEEYSFGRPVSKTWETRMTGTVRDTHRRMQGTTVGIDELFRVPREKGGYDLMLHPGDSTHGASAENIVNCRCWCSYEYDD